MRRMSLLLLVGLSSLACRSEDSAVEPPEVAGAEGPAAPAWAERYEPTAEQVAALHLHHERTAAVGVAYAPGLLEFLVVPYVEERVVLIDDVAMGMTNRLLLVPRGVRRVSLEGGGALPIAQDLPVEGSSPEDPVEAQFEPDPNAHR